MENILILTYWSYSDALIQTYTLPYVRIIKKILPSESLIYLLTLEKSQDTISESTRTKISAKLEQEGIKWLPFDYKPFGLGAFFLWIGISLKLCFLTKKKKISVLHCWCTPAGAVGYFLSFILRAKLILDSYEPHAEAMVENGTWRPQSLSFKLLFWLEKKQTQRASYVVATTKGMHDYAKIKYQIDIKNFHVKPACVDLNLFSERALNDKQLRYQLNLENKIVCVYAGKFGGIYLEDEVFDFIKVASDHWGEAFRFLILTSHTYEEINTYCNRAGVSMDYIILRFVAHEKVPRYLGLADFALTPVKPVPTKRYCSPIKDGEYWALGLPVVIPHNISEDSDIIQFHHAGSVLNEFSVAAYKEALQSIALLLQNSRKENYINIRQIAIRYRSYTIAEQVYESIYGGKSI
jgi:hypothetical protein